MQKTVRIFSGQTKLRAGMFIKEARRVRMLLGYSDIELLRLAAWCKNLPSDISKSIHSQILNPARIKLLDAAGLVNTSENGDCIRLRELGWDFIRHLGFEYHKDSRYVSDYGRRLESARILLTFWRAGYNVFGSTLRDMGAPRVFIHSMAARRDSVQGGNIWGGAAFWGLGRLGNTAASCYYFTGHEKALLNYRSEKTMLDKAASFLGAKPAMIFAGKGDSGAGYVRMARVLGNTKAAKVTGSGEKLTYSDIYRGSQIPIHLLECSDEGALQLLIMSLEDYRKRLGGVIFSGVNPPPVGVGGADGSLGVSDTMPWLLAIDMDICRIGRAIRQTAAAGYPMIVIACLSKQEAALKLLFGENAAKYVIITEKNITDAFGAVCLYEPAPGPYLDSKGGMIDAAALPVHRKMGKQAHRKTAKAPE